MIFFSDSFKDGYLEAITNFFNGILTPHSFKNLGSLKGIVCPPDLEVINESAFEGCTYLEEIILNENLKSLENNCFKNCRRLKKN